MLWYPELCQFLILLRCFFCWFLKAWSGPDLLLYCKTLNSGYAKKKKKNTVEAIPTQVRPKMCVKTAEGAASMGVYRFSYLWDNETWPRKSSMCNICEFKGLLDSKTLSSSCCRKSLLQLFLSFAAAIARLTVEILRSRYEVIHQKRAPSRIRLATAPFCRWRCVAAKSLAGLFLHAFAS